VCHATILRHEYVHYLELHRNSDNDEVDPSTDPCFRHAIVYTLLKYAFVIYVYRSSDPAS